MLDAAGEQFNVMLGVIRIIQVSTAFSTLLYAHKFRSTFSVLRSISDAIDKRLELSFMHTYLYNE